MRSNAVSLTVPATFIIREMDDQFVFNPENGVAGQVGIVFNEEVRHQCVEALLADYEMDVRRTIWVATA